MSLVSHAIYEMSLINTPDNIKNKVLELLVPIGEAGHSGGSIGIFSGWVSNWANDPVEITEKDSMLLPLWKVISDLSYENRKTVLDILYKVISYKPLSLLTGEESEWFMHDESTEEGNYYQNKRCGHIFKHGDRAYNIEGRIFYEPSTSHLGWIGWQGTGSSVDITFPYDACTEPERIYYTDASRTFILPKEIDPEAWVKLRNRRLLAGFNQDGSLEAKTVLMTYDEAVSVVETFLAEMPIPRELTFEDWPNETDNHKPLPPNLATLVEEHKFSVRVARVKALVDPRAMLLPNGNYRFSDSREYALRICQVMRPTAFYAGWENAVSAVGNNEYAIIFTPDLEGDAKLYLDTCPWRLVDDDPDSYLYHKRREYGYPHPKRKTKLNSELCKGNSTIPYIDEDKPIAE